MVIVEAGVLSASQAQSGLASASAASPSSRIRFFKRLICRTLKQRSSAALAHAMSPLMHALITLTRCSSFWLNVNVSCLMG